jgi:hypothetical protein
MMHRGPQARRATDLGHTGSRRLLAMSQSSFEGSFDALREVHGVGSLTRCITFVNHGMIFAHPVDISLRCARTRVVGHLRFVFGFDLQRWLGEPWTAIVEAGRVGALGLARLTRIDSHRLIRVQGVGGDWLHGPSGPD